FNKKFNKMNDWNGEAYGTSEKAYNWIAGIFKVGESWNTYNGEEFLSQTLQGTNLHLRGNESNFEFPDYVLLQVHNGADVRGGYTDAKLFKLNGYLMGAPDVYGTIDGIDVSTSYNGDSLTNENGGSVVVKPNSKIELFLSELYY